MNATHLIEMTGMAKGASRSSFFLPERRRSLTPVGGDSVGPAPTLKTKLYQRLCILPDPQYRTLLEILRAMEYYRLITPRLHANKPHAASAGP